MSPDSLAPKAELYHSALAEFQGAIRTAHAILAEMSDVAASSRQTLTECDKTLRHRLSRFHSLRHKDFDQWFQGASVACEQAEEDLRASVREYLAEQSELSERIVFELSSLRSERAERLGEVAALLAEFSRLHAARREWLKSTLAAFKESQETWRAELRAMLVEAKEIRLSEAKALFEKFKRDAEARRLALRERRAEVAALLEKFRQERLNKNPKP
ncbi:MAG: hypothetical protein NZM06_11190 [Chloroherpetonaceae bacterium]|nr:hypothetical protein [Chloroherpetonaceae bacterium]MDW8438177.1 hypothetical protein [Chloroherpetonaceae bacterium]